jgi:hypothetical protein
MTEDEKGGGIHISGVQGDVSGVSSGGIGNIVGKNVVVGSGTINVSENQLQKIPGEYAESLKAFSEAVNQQLKDREVTEEKVNSINQSLSELAKEVEGIIPGKEKEVDYEKRTRIESKTAGVVQRVLNALPAAAETAATFTPLAPFSKLIGKGVQTIVDAIQK